MNLQVWVTGFEEQERNSVCLKGISLDGALGFGGLPTREYRGRLALIGTKGKVELPSGKVTLGHGSQTGHFWKLESVSLRLPQETPFLMTDEQKVECVFYGKVFLETAEPYGSIIDDLDDESNFILGSKNWYGVLQVFPQEGRQGTLWAFSSDSKANPLLDKVFLIDRENEEFGWLRRQ